MKKLFGMIAIVLLFSSVVFAGTKLLDLQTGKTINVSELGDTLAVFVLCNDGYKFVIVRSYDERGIPATGGVATGLSIVQFYENKNGNAVPARC